MPHRQSQLQSLLVDASTEGFVVADEQGRIRYTNPAACQIFGYSNVELLGLSVEDLMPREHRDMHQGLRQGYNRKPIGKPMGKGRNLRALRKDGSSFYVEISLTPLAVEGGKWVFALITDVDVRVKLHLENEVLNQKLKDLLEARTLELSQTQQLYQVVARNYPNGMICVLDDRFNCLFAEGQSLVDLRMTGKEMAGTPYLDHVPDALQSSMRTHLKEALNSGNDSIEVEHDGHWFQVDSVALDGPNAGQLLVIEQNISTAVEALKKEKEVNEWMSRFVSMASHEFRTPLSTISLSADLSARHLEQGKTERVAPHLEKIQGSIRHMTHMLNDYLNLEKLGSGEFKGAEQNLDLASVLRDLVAEAEVAATEAHTFVLDLSHDALQQSRMFCSLEVVVGMVSNLLSNAVKYSPKGGQTTVRLSSEDGQWVLSFQDEGLGISRQDLPLIFKRFYRAESTHHIPGTGVGLDLVMQYVQTLGGSLNCESTLGQGSCFTLKWPQKTGPNSAQKPAS